MSQQNVETALAILLESNTGEVSKDYACRDAIFYRIEDYRRIVGSCGFWGVILMIRRGLQFERISCLHSFLGCSLG